MPVSTKDIIEACNVVASQEHLTVCVSESLKGAGMAGAGAFTGAMIFGPVGMAIGAAVGGIAGAVCAKHYVPLAQILTTMSEDDKAKLANHMLQVLQKLDITDAIVLMSVVTSPETLGRKAIVGGLAAYYGENWS